MSSEDKQSCPFAGTLECPKRKKRQEELALELLNLTIKEKQNKVLTKLLEEDK